MFTNSLSCVAAVSAVTPHVIAASAATPHAMAASAAIPHTIASSTTALASLDAKQKSCCSDEIKAFISDAKSENGILVSTCNLNPSGCHGFGQTLKQKYPNLLHVKSTIDQKFCPNFVYEKSKNNQWNNLFYTGCSWKSGKMMKYVIEKILNEFSITKLETLYLISPPHLQRTSVPYSDLYNQFSVILEPLKSRYKKIVLLTTGFDKADPMNIGLPTVLYKVNDSKYTLDDNCYGMIYTRQAQAYMMNHSMQFSIEAYFKHIAEVGQYKKDVYVMMIGYTHDYYNAYAKKYHIKMMCFPVLPQCDYVNVIYQLRLKGGAIFTDGAYTHMQACQIGADAFYFAHSSNLGYRDELLRLVPQELQTQDVAKVLLRASHDDFDYDEVVTEAVDVPACRRVLSLFKSIMQQGVELFERYHADVAVREVDQKQTQGVKRKIGDIITPGISVNAAILDKKLKQAPLTVKSKSI